MVALAYPMRNAPLRSLNSMPFAKKPVLTLAHIVAALLFVLLVPFQFTAADGVQITRVEISWPASAPTSSARARKQRTPTVWATAITTEPTASFLAMDMRDSERRSAFGRGSVVSARTENRNSLDTELASLLSGALFIATVEGLG